MTKLRSFKSNEVLGTYDRFQSSADMGRVGARAHGRTGNIKNVPTANTIFD